MTSPASDKNEWSGRRLTLAGLAVTGLTFGGVGTWAMTATLAGAVVAPAELRVETKPAPVSHPQGGVVADILVTEGQTVKAGEALLAFDAGTEKATVAIFSGELQTLQATRARLRAERDGKRIITFAPDLLAEARTDRTLREALTDQRALFTARRASRAQRGEQLSHRKAGLEQDIAAARAQGQSAIQRLGLARDQKTRRQRLYERGYATRNSVEMLEGETLTLEGRLASILAEIRGYQRQIDEIAAQRMQIEEEARERALSDLRETDDRITSARERKTVAARALHKVTLTAPRGGVVQSLAVHAPGAVVGPGQPVLTIVPVADRLVLEARIPARERDRLYPGQKARVRFPAFNQRTTPEITARITRIAPDRLIDPGTGAAYYDVALLAPDTEIARLGPGQTLRPGMPADLFISTGERTAMSYLLKPFTDFMAGAGRER